MTLCLENLISKFKLAPDSGVRSGDRCEEKEEGTEEITLISVSLEADRKLERELHPKDQVFNCLGL